MVPSLLGQVGRGATEAALMQDARAGAPVDDGQREFLLVVRQALLMVVCWIERRYGLTRPPR